MITWHKANAVRTCLRTNLASSKHWPKRKTVGKNEYEQEKEFLGSFMQLCRFLLDLQVRGCPSFSVASLTDQVKVEYGVPSPKLWPLDLTYEADLKLESCSIVQFKSRHVFGVVSKTWDSRVSPNNTQHKSAFLFNPTVLERWHCYTRLVNCTQLQITTLITLGSVTITVARKSTRRKKNAVDRKSIVHGISFGLVHPYEKGKRLCTILFAVVHKR